MWRFILLRLAGGAVTLLLASFIVFGAMYLVPGDPLGNLIGGMNITPDQIAIIRNQYGLDLPFWQRYFEWLSGALRGDFGLSLQFQQNVTGLIASRIPTTAMLVAMSAIWIVIGGLVLGTIAAFKAGRIDRAIVSITATTAAVPVFITALLLIYAFSTGLRWFPAFGNGDGFFDQVYHLFLPSLAMGIFYVGLVTRATRSSMRSELDSEYVAVARVRGIVGWPLFSRHVLRTSLPSIMTISSVLIAGLLVSSQIVEVSFGLSGVGSLLIQSVRSIDFSVVQAITMLVITAFVVTNLVVDLIMPLIDPRIARRGGSR
jgi:peptide/nickel transport system permease protein